MTDSTLLGLKAEWRGSRVCVRRAIWSSKKESWKELLSEVDADMWGFPFRIVTKKLRSSSGPLTAGMMGEFLAEVIAELFSRVAPYAFHPARFAFDRDRDRVTEKEIRILLDAASKKRSAPSPNGMHYRLLGKSVGVMSSRLSSLFTACFEEASFPKQWKFANLVLLEKPGRDPSTLGAYRPICLLEVEGKLFERVVASRIIGHMGADGGGTTFLRISTASGRAVRRSTRSFESVWISRKLCAGAESRSRFR